MIEVSTGKSNVSDHALRRMKKQDVTKLFREIEKKLYDERFGCAQVNNQKDDLLAEKDDLLVQEAMNKKTIMELNESNKKLMDKVKFYQNQKESSKRKDDKLNDYFDKGLLEKIRDLDTEVVRLEEICRQRFIQIEKFKKEKQELINECIHKNEDNEKLEEQLGIQKATMDLMQIKHEQWNNLANARLGVYMSYLHDAEAAISNLRLNDEELLKEAHNQ